MSATRRDFEAIARTISNGREHFKSNTEHARFADELAVELSLTSTRFDRKRFVLACMPSAWVGSSKTNIWERLARRAERIEQHEPECVRCPLCEPDVQRRMEPDAGPLRRVERTTIGRGADPSDVLHLSCGHKVI